MLPTPNLLPWLFTTNALVQGIKMSIFGMPNKGVGKFKNMNDVLLSMGCENDPIAQPIDTKVGGKKVHKPNDLLQKWVIHTHSKDDYASAT